MFFILLGVPLLACVGFAALAIYINAYGHVDRARPAQAIVILGARVLSDGLPGINMRARTQHAVELYRRGLAPRIICTGGVGSYPPAEAVAESLLAQQAGVPAGDLILEDKSASTRENALFAARICREHGWKQVIIVSDPYHLWRAQREFGRAGLEAYPSPALQDARRRDPRYRMTIRETWLVIARALSL